MIRISWGVTTVVLAATLAACTNLDGLSGPGQDAGGDALASPDAHADASSDGSDPRDGGDGGASTCGPKSVLVPGTTACIDATEVSVVDYAAFLAAKGGDVSGQPSACTWNATYIPSGGWPPAADAGAIPVTWVDWCDAFAYCAWAGKHLCGAIGGGSSTLANAANPATDLWYRACSHAGDGQHLYPYGSAYSPTTCRGGDDQDASTQTPVPVGSKSACEGGYAGVFDMAGNAAEWEDSCISSGTPASDTCLARGGGYHAPPATMQCGAVVDQLTRSTALDWTGIRCCSDAQ